MAESPLKNFKSKDNALIWHPYAVPDLYAESIPIVKALGAHLFDEQNNKIIDAISSWWTTLHGHSNPHIGNSIVNQQKKLDHVIFSGFTHEPAIRLAEKLIQLLPENQKKVFYSDNGSTAVEVALKMALQSQYINGGTRRKIIAFKNAYHGDTFGAMSVSGRGLFTAPFEKLLFEVDFIDAPIPGLEESSCKQLEQLLFAEEKPAAFIFEPILQGTAGMVMHDASVLSKIIKMCKANNVITIADEVLVGFGRTGKFFASDYLTEKADIFCLSKGLTGGSMALGVTTCCQKIYDSFHQGEQHVFFHGHSYTGNPICCAAALASLEIFDENPVFEQISAIEKCHQQFVGKIMMHPKIKSIRTIGTILAIELVNTENTSYSNSLRKIAYDYFLSKGILLRPLGNIIYLMPPYCIEQVDLQYIYHHIELFLQKMDNAI